MRRATNIPGVWTGPAVYTSGPFIGLAVTSALLATIATAHALGGYIDQYPDDPEAFACAVPPVDITNDGAFPQECSLLLTRCIDVTTGTCVAAFPKACRQAHEDCFAMVDEVCWPMVGD